MSSMTSAPLTGPPDPPRAAKPPPRARRLVLLPAAQESGRGDELVRRYRLARLRLEPRETRGDERFAHLRTFHD
jgi:hypothetical protein